MLIPIAVNEPILASKITGPGQRATLSSLLKDGMKAVTIRVNDVGDVAGFVLPGDHVDVVLTRPGDKKVSVNDVVLQDVRVLGVDQLADNTTDKPAVVKAVTLEVDETGGQKLALASMVGTLSLLLRKAGETERRPDAADFGRWIWPTGRADAALSSYSPSWSRGGQECTLARSVQRAGRAQKTMRMRLRLRFRRSTWRTSEALGGERRNGSAKWDEVWGRQAAAGRPT